MRKATRSSDEAVTKRCIKSATAVASNVVRCSAFLNVFSHCSPWLQCANKVQKHASFHCSSVRAALRDTPHGMHHHHISLGLQHH